MNALFIVGVLFALTKTVTIFQSNVSDHKERTFICDCSQRERVQLFNICCSLSLQHTRTIMNHQTDTSDKGSKRRDQATANELKQNTPSVYILFIKKQTYLINALYGQLLVQLLICSDKTFSKLSVPHISSLLVNGLTHLVFLWHIMNIVRFTLDI